MTEKKRTSGSYSSLRGFHRAVPIILVAVAVFTFFCFILQDMGAFGNIIATVFLGLFAGGAYALPVLLILHAIFYASDLAEHRMLSRVIFSLVTLTAISALAYAITYWNSELVFNAGEFFANGKNAVGGGFIGSIIGFCIIKAFSKVGLIIITAAVFAIYISYFFARGQKNVSRIFFNIFKFIIILLAYIEDKIKGLFRAMKKAKNEKKMREAEFKNQELTDDEFFGVDNGMHKLRISELGISETRSKEFSEINPTLQEKIFLKSEVSREEAEEMELREKAEELFYKPRSTTSEDVPALPKRRIINVTYGDGLGEEPKKPESEIVVEEAAPEAEPEIVKEPTVSQESAESAFGTETATSTRKAILSDDRADAIFTHDFDPFSMVMCEELASKPSSRSLLDEKPKAPVVKEEITELTEESIQRARQLEDFEKRKAEIINARRATPVENDGEFSGTPKTVSFREHADATPEEFEEDDISLNHTVDKTPEPPVAEPANYTAIGFGDEDYTPPTYTRAPEFTVPETIFSNDDFDDEPMEPLFKRSIPSSGTKNYSEDANVTHFDFSDAETFEAAYENLIPIYSDVPATIVFESPEYEEIARKMKEVPEETPTIEKATVIESAPTVEQTPVIKSAPIVEQTPVIEATPIVEQTPVIEATPAVQEIPVTSSAFVNEPVIILKERVEKDTEAVKEPTAPTYVVEEVTIPEDTAKVVKDETINDEEIKEEEIEEIVPKLVPLYEPPIVMIYETPGLNRTEAPKASVKEEPKAPVKEDYAPQYTQPEPAPAYQTPVYAQPQAPVYQTPVYAQPQAPVYQTPVYAQPQAPVYQTPAYVQPQAPVYQTPVYAQPQAPTYQTPTYAQPQVPVYEAPMPQYVQPEPVKEAPVPQYVKSEPVKEAPVYEAPKTPAVEEIAPQPVPESTPVIKPTEEKVVTPELSYTATKEFGKEETEVEYVPEFKPYQPETAEEASIPSEMVFEFDANDNSEPEKVNTLTIERTIIKDDESESVKELADESTEDGFEIDEEYDSFDAPDEEAEETYEDIPSSASEEEIAEEDGTWNTEEIPPEERNPIVEGYKNMFPVLNDDYDITDEDEAEEEDHSLDYKLISPDEEGYQGINDSFDEDDDYDVPPFEIDDTEEDEEPEDVPESKPEKKKPDYSDYKMPPIELLGLDPQVDDDTSEINENTKILIDTLASFNVTASIKGVDRGPRITRYEVVPARGVKVNAITNLFNDIELNLAREGIRMQAPIPGKSAIGFEIPNRHPKNVRLRELLECEEFINASSKSFACIGKDVAGNPVFADVSKFPHALIAGATGMGKSVCINSIMISMLYKARPDEVKFIMIDPKKVEFKMYSGIPHLLIPVITEAKQAAGALMWAVEEMERRFDLIEKSNLRNIGAYNEKAESTPGFGEKLPKIVIVIDELNDLMMQVRDPVEDLIMRLAQKARAAGIHIIIGTQRPDVKVITGTIKANIPTRMSCKVSSVVDSRTILEMQGAEKLLDKGDMLFKPIDKPKPIRVQGAFVSDSEVENIMNFLKDQVKENVYDEEIFAEINKAAQKCGNKKSGGASAEDFVDEDQECGYYSDQQFLDAVDLAIRSKKISTSLLQRKLSIGYGKAAKYIDAMEEIGIVSEPKGQKPRDVLLTMDEWHDKLSRVDLG